MRKLNNELKNRIIDYDKLIKYGFTNDNNKYFYEENILDDTFKVIIEINNENITSKLIEIELNDEYLMVDNQDATGEYVGMVREIYEKIIHNIINECSHIEIFQNKQTKEIIKYIKDKYNDDLEFLWDKLPEAAIWRNKKNNKWYGLLMKINKDKLGLKDDELIESINLKYNKNMVHNIVNNKNIFPGYHMNKSSWITIILDASINSSEIYKLIDNSYNLSISNKKWYCIKDIPKIIKLWYNVIE